MFYRSSRFRKQFKKLSIKNRQGTLERLEKLAANEFDGILKNHKLSGKYSDYWSISITGDVRLIYKKISGGFYLVAIGTHSELYE